ncbi:MAG: hypothetical protein AAFV07_20245, partial [Bacteroidota bacterium]
MKTIKICALLVIACLLQACDLNENPPFLDTSIYSSPQSSRAALDGIYQALTNYNSQERRYIVASGFSGLFVTRSGGANVNNINNTTLYALKPVSNNDFQELWG